MSRDSASSMLSEATMPFIQGASALGLWDESWEGRLYFWG